MKMAEFELQKLAKEGNALLAEAKNVLKKTKIDNIDEIIKEIPETIITDEKKLKIVFAGQYSAGKSTLIKALTGNNDIAVGAGITTQQSHYYDWNGIDICDTPGIHTSLRKDHDEITYKAISDASLVVFVVTNELFNADLAEHFRKLAIEHDKGREMMLVINKMSRHAMGNSEEAHKIISKDLEKVIAPLSTEQLYISFIDAKDYVDAEIEDEEFKEELIEQSGFNDFVANLNRFVKEKNIVSSYTTSLYKLQEVLGKVLDSDTSDDANVNMTINTLEQRRNALVEAENNIKDRCSFAIQTAFTETNQKGLEIASLIGSASGETINKELEESSSKIDKIVEVTADKLQKIILGETSDLCVKLSDICKLEATKLLIKSLNNRFSGNSTNINASSVGKATQELGNFIVNQCQGSGLGSYLCQCSGSNMHNTVKAIGNLFGKKFWPWEAVKWTQKIASVGRFLSIAGPVVAIAVETYNLYQESKNNDEMIEAKRAIRSGFNDAANNIEMHFNEQLNSYVADNIRPDIAKTDEDINKIRKQKAFNNNIMEKLSDLNNRASDLINRIHGVVVSNDYYLA